MQTPLDHDKPSSASGTRSRELARRRSGADEVLLVWHPDGDRLELSVLDATTAPGVEPGRAMDAPSTTRTRTPCGVRAPAVRSASRTQGGRHGANAPRGLHDHGHEHPNRSGRPSARERRFNHPYAYAPREAA